jgi:hypothetical protein
MNPTHPTHPWNADSHIGQEILLFLGQEADIS